jgi:hypothetical protein
MRITIYVHNEDLENLNTAITALEYKHFGENQMLDSVKILRYRSLDFVEVSLSYDDYVKCIDLGIFEELLSL